MKVTPMTIMAMVLILGALYMLAVRKPAAKKLKVRFEDEVKGEDPALPQNRPAPAHIQADPNEKLW